VSSGNDKSHAHISILN